MEEQDKLASDIEWALSHTRGDYLDQDDVKVEAVVGEGHVWIITLSNGHEYSLTLRLESPIPAR